jgi:hypothetical protein
MYVEVEIKHLNYFLLRFDFFSSIISLFLLLFHYFRCTMHEALLSPLFSCYKESPFRSPSSTSVQGGMYTSLTSTASVSSVSSFSCLSQFKQNNFHLPGKRGEPFRRYEGVSPAFPELREENEDFVRSFMYYHKPNSTGEGVGADRLPLL